MVYFVLCPLCAFSDKLEGSNEQQPIDLIQVRQHIQFKVDENEAARDRLRVFTMAHTV